uniref:PDZ domain-containing protein n=1 Tax=Parastrongyloides trichosuri TaxID=131310 RepID=A0A0N4Z6R5_PARTI
MNTTSISQTIRSKASSAREKVKSAWNDSKTPRKEGVSSAKDRSRKIFKKPITYVQTLIKKEPGMIEIIDREWPSYKNYTDYESLIKQMEEENNTEKSYNVICNASVRENSLTLDENNHIISIAPGSPLNHLLLYDDKVIECGNESLSDGAEKVSIPEKTVKHMKLKISRQGRATPVPAMRIRKHNLVMENNDYYYYIVEVPRITGVLLGFDMVWNCQQSDAVVVNITSNTIGSYIFEQGDHIVDINEILLTDEDTMKEILKDPKTYPSFTCLVKKPFSKSAIESTKKFINSLNTIFIKADVKEIASKLESQIQDFIKNKTSIKPCLKEYNLNRESYDLGYSTENPYDKLPAPTFQTLETEIIEFEGNIQNPLFLEPISENNKYIE